MLDMLNVFFEKLAAFVWNYPAVGLCLLASVFYTFRLLFVQVRCFPHALAIVTGRYDDPNDKGQITHFQALSAALSGTVGIGNIGGVAIAIAIGGPGAVLWMWLIAFLGMAAKFAECTLGMHFREENPETGEVRGGPMYYIVKGLGEKWRPLASSYAIFACLAALGFTCMFQTNQAATALDNNYHIAPWITGLVLAACTALVIIGGIRRIGLVAAKIVPLMCSIYLIGAIVICVMNFEKIPSVFCLIVYDGLTGSSVVGGTLGTVMIWGIRRAIFSNEAGLGSASIAHAAVKTKYPVREGMVASLGPFIDTIIICSATAFVIILSGHFGTQMYQTRGNVLDFKSSTPQVQIMGDWSIVSDNVPEEKEVLRHFRQGSGALRYQSSVSSHKNAKLSLTLTSTDGIRFSYYRKTGNMKIRLFQGEKELGELNLVAGKDKIISQGGDLVQALGYQTSMEWKSCVLKFSGNLKKSLGNEAHEMHLQFVPQGKQVEWYVDNVHGVNKAEGIALSIASFDKFIEGFGTVFITIAALLFAFSTMITWEYYGETSAQFLWGSAVVLPYRWIFVILAFVGAIVELNLIVNFSDAMVGLLVIPNAIAILLLSNKVVAWTKEYIEQLKNGEFTPTKKS